MSVHLLYEFDTTEAGRKVVKALIGVEMFLILAGVADAAVNCGSPSGRQARPLLGDGRA
jgi:hypothetical protein